MHSHLVDAAATTGVANAILGLAHAQGRTVQDIHLGTKIPRTTLDRSLSGIRPFPTTELFAVAAYLGTTPEELVASARRAA